MISTIAGEEEKRGIMDPKNIPGVSPDLSLDDLQEVKPGTTQVKHQVCFSDPFCLKKGNAHTVIFLVEIKGK